MATLLDSVQRTHQFYHFLNILFRIIHKINGLCLTFNVRLYGFLLKYIIDNIYHTLP